MFKQQKGMTLLGLSFTILVLLALAAIAIAMVLDEISYDPEPIQMHTEQQAANNETPLTEPIDNNMPQDGIQQPQTENQV